MRRKPDHRVCLAVGAKVETDRGSYRVARIDKSGLGPQVIDLHLVTNLAWERAERIAYEKAVQAELGAKA